jgi:predicted nucleic acid-binding protein
VPTANKLILYDSMIVSSALESGCTVLYSEDMQHGQEIDTQLVISNPFFDNSLSFKHVYNKHEHTQN